MNNRIFNEIAESLENDTLKRRCISLSKRFTSTRQADLQKAYELVIDLYLMDRKKEILLISEELEKIDFTGDFNLWTWIEAILLLRCKILHDTKQVVDLKNTIIKIKVVDTYEWDQELKTTINRKVRKRRIEEKSLLRYDKLESAIKSGDFELELEIRILNGIELLLIYFLSESAPLEIFNEIEENEKQMKMLYQNL